MSQPLGQAPPRPPIGLAKEISFRPLLVPACAFIAGILLREYFSGLTPAAVVAAVTLAALVPAAYFFMRRPVLLHVLVVALAFASGYVRQAWERREPPANDVSRLVPPEGALLRVRGVVATRPMIAFTPADRIFQTRDFRRTRFNLDVDSVETAAGWRAATGTVQVNVYDDATDCAYGDRIELLSQFARPPRPTSTGQFDYREFLERTGIRLRTSVKARAALGPVLSRHEGNFAVELAQGLGARLSRTLDRNHDPREAGLLRCILLGERSAVDPETDQEFRLAGISYLLAISGLHIVILLGGMWIVLRFFGAPERAIAWGVLVSAALYAGVASFQPPVVRAAVVMGMFSLGVIVRRKHDMLNSLAVSALVLLALRPYEVFSSGFQLSFIAVLGLVALATPLAEHLSLALGFRGLDLLPGARRPWRVKANRFFVAALAVAVAAWLTTQPLIAWHYRMLNPTTILLNLILIPAFGVVLFAAFVALLVEAVFGGFIVSAVSGFLAQVMMGFSEAGSRLPGAWITFPQPPGWVLALFYALLVLAAVAPAIGLRRTYFAIPALAILVGLVGREMIPSAPASAELVVLDVGQGSAALVRSPEGRTALVDVGTFGSKGVSRMTVIPWLVEARVRSLDAVLLTHADSDHTSGLPDLVENFGVRKVYLGDTFRYTRTGLAVERWLIDRGVPHEFLSAGDSLDLGGVRLEVLHPPRGPKCFWEMMEWRPGTHARHPHGGWSENERSLVVRGVTANGTFLIFGDAAGKGMKHLSLREDLRADVVVAPHHGGKSGAELLAPQYRWPRVLFSAGARFANSRNLAAYRASGAETLVTRDAGTITVRFTRPVSIETFRLGPVEPPDEDDLDPSASPENPGE